MSEGVLLDLDKLTSLERAVESVRVAAYAMPPGAPGMALGKLQRVAAQWREYVTVLRQTWSSVCHQVVIERTDFQLQQHRELLVGNTRQLAAVAQTVRDCLKALPAEEGESGRLIAQMAADAAEIEKISRRFAEPWETAEDLERIAVENYKFPPEVRERLAVNTGPPTGQSDDDLDGLY